MVSATSESRYITTASRYHPHYQSRSSMYIRGLIPLHFSELSKTVPIAVLRDLSSFAIILPRKREREREIKLVALLQLSSRCHVAAGVMGLFIMVQWVGLHCVIVTFAGNTHLLNGFLMDCPSLTGSIKIVCYYFTTLYVS